MTRSKLLLALVLNCAVAMPSYAQFGVAWRVSPSDTVIGAESDPRQVMVEKAVAFWNRTLQEQGTSFRIGSITKLKNAIPESELASLSNAVVGRSGGLVSVPGSLTSITGDVLVYLGDTVFVSFVSPFSADRKKVVGMRTMSGPPMSLPNVALNVVIHELGHAIGIGHNSDETTLMCGRPANCRPDAFFLNEEKIFPLSELELAQIRAMYPPSWKAQP
jgi:hypothetical protein